MPNKKIYIPLSQEPITYIKNYQYYAAYYSWSLKNWQQGSPIIMNIWLFWILNQITFLSSKIFCNVNYPPRIHVPIKQQIKFHPIPNLLWYLFSPWLWHCSILSHIIKYEPKIMSRSIQQRQQTLKLIKLTENTEI